MRFLFVNRFYRPDHSATSQLLTDLAEYLAAEGFAVSVIASAALYSNPEERLPLEETLAGVSVRRVGTSRFGRGSLVGRAVDYLTFYFSAAGRLLSEVRRGDVVVAKTDPPLISVLCGLVCRLKGARLITWLQDLYPEVATAHGLSLGLFGPLLRSLRDGSLRQARANVAISPAMAARVRAAGVPAKRTEVVQNWTDDHAIVPAPPEANALRDAWGLKGRLVIGYSGNLGRAHEYETLLGAAERLTPDLPVTFLFIGGGHNSDPLMQAVKARGLESRFLFQPYQPRERLSLSLGVPDLHWVSLLPEFEGLIFPSKFYGAAAAGRGILVVADPAGEMAQLVARRDCGVAVGIGDADGLARLLSELAADPARARAMGVRARAFIDQEASRAMALAAWGTILRNLEPEGSRK